MRDDIRWKTHNGKVNILKIKEFENRICFKFPISYKKFITEYDGAKISNNIDSFDFFSKLTNKIETYGLGCFLSFYEDNSSSMKFYWDNRNCDQNYPFPVNIVPFAIDGSGEEICFDYRHDAQTNEPKIVVWHHEGESGKEEELSFVADTFEEFINMLYDDRTEEDKKLDEEYLNGWKNFES